MKNYNLDYGMPTLIENRSLHDNVRTCRKLGLQFIELNMNLPEYQVEQLKDRKVYQDISDRYGIYFTIHLEENLNVADFNHAVAQSYVDTVRRTIEVAHELHVPVLNMHMNHGIHFTLPDRKVQLYEQYEEAYLESMERFIQMCESEISADKIQICIENTDGFKEYEKAALERMLVSRVFSLTWDIGHSNSCDNVDEPFLMEHEDKLKHFHIHDSIGSRAHLTLGSGEIDLNQRLSIAKEHECRCVVETKTLDSLKESVEWLKRNRYMNNHRKKYIKK